MPAHHRLSNAAAAAAAAALLDRCLFDLRCPPASSQVHHGQSHAGHAAAGPDPAQQEAIGLQAGCIGRRCSRTSLRPARGDRRAGSMP